MTESEIYNEIRGCCISDESAERAARKIVLMLMKNKTIHSNNICDYCIYLDRDNGCPNCNEGCDLNISPDNIDMIASGFQGVKAIIEKGE